MRCSCALCARRIPCPATRPAHHPLLHPCRSHPAQANPNGSEYSPTPPDLLLIPTFMFSVAYPQDYAPAWFGAAQRAAFAAPLKARLPGARVQLTRHVFHPLCGRHGRRVLAANATTEHRPVVASACASRLIVNVAVVHSDRARLQALLQTVESRPRLIWGRQQVRHSTAGGCVVVVRQSRGASSRSAPAW